MPSRLRHWSHPLFSLLSKAIPSSCALCGVTGDDAICGGCHQQFFRRRLHRCTQCAMPLREMSVSATRCGACLANPPAFDATVVAADYAPPVDQLVLALKFGGRLALAPLFAGMLRDALLTDMSEMRGDVGCEAPALPMQLVAVPLGPQRLAERGFNQALEIARPLSRAIGVGLDMQLVTRQRDTQAQSLLHPDERHRNIRHAFVVPAESIEQVRGQHIGVVDDVMTTGETLNELAATLKRFGAVRVTNLVFARTAQK